MIQMTAVKAAAATAAIMLSASALSADVLAPWGGMGPNGFGVSPFAPNWGGVGGSNGGFGLLNTIDYSAPWGGSSASSFNGSGGLGLIFNPGFGVSPFAPNWGGVGGSNGGFGVLNPWGGGRIDGLGLAALLGYGYSLNPLTPGLRSIGGVSVGGASITGVQCTFGDEMLLASSVGSCENAGGAVAPSQVTYSVQCEIAGETVMTGSTAGCVRAGGNVASQ